MVLERHHTTVEGSELVARWSWRYGRVFINDARVESRNIEAPDAIVHGIDGVLLPPTGGGNGDDEGDDD